MAHRWISDGRWLVIAAVVIAVGCGQEAQQPDNQQPDEDTGVEEDVGVPQDADDADADTGVDAGEDADAGDVDVEDPEYERDQSLDEGLDGPDDNCPLISNPDQADRSRDGIGDACDNFPYIYDPSNPEAVEVIHEDDGPPNDNSWDASQDWNFEPPFAVEGTISEPGAVDWYAVTVEEPTTLLIHLEAQTSSIWPGLIVMGDDFALNRHFSAGILGLTDGESEVRDLHLPLPGTYLLAISDVRNLLSGQADTGGDNYDYGMYVSSPSRPEGEPLSVPTPSQVVPYGEGEAHVFSVDVAGEDALRVEAAGAPRNQSSMLLPAIYVSDSDTGEMLAFTIEDQVDTDAFRSDVTLKLGEDLDQVDVLIEAHTSLGQNDIVVDFETFEKPEQHKSFDEPRLLREDPLLWLRPYADIRSMVGPPIPDGDTALEPDEDRMLLYTSPGDFVRIEAEPTSDSRLIPELGIGRVSTFGTFISWHEGVQAQNPGDTSWLSAYVTSENFRDSMLNVIHADNDFTNDLPVGGPDYDYDMNIETLDPYQEAVDGGEEFPATVQVELDIGEQGLYDFDFRPGYNYSVDFDGQFGREIELIDLYTGELLEQDRSGFSFLHRPDRAVMLGVRDDRGREIEESDDVHIDVSESGDGPVQVEPPEQVDAQFESEHDFELYSFTASAGDFVQIQTHAEDGDAPMVELLASPVETTPADPDETTAIARIEEDTELLAGVSASSDEDVEFTVDFQLVEPVDTELPADGQELFADGHSEWWSVPIDEVWHLAVNVTGETVDEQPVAFSVYDADTLERLDVGEGFGIVETRQIDHAYIAVHPPEDELEADIEPGVSISAVEPYLFDENFEELEFSDGIRPEVVAFEPDTGGLTNIEIFPDDDRLLYTELTDVVYDADAAVTEPVGPATVVANDAHRARVVAVPREGGTEEWSADFELEFLEPDDAQPLEHDQALPDTPYEIEDWPAAYQTSIDDDEELSARSFTADFEPGDRLSAVVLPAVEDPADEIVPEIQLLDPDMEEVAVFGDGEQYPLIRDFELDEEGFWQLNVVADVGIEQHYAVMVMKH